MTKEELVSLLAEEKSKRDAFHREAEAMLTAMSARIKLLEELIERETHEIGRAHV